MRLGFVGLGRMGWPMARNLLRAGFPITVHGRSPGPVAELVAAGARAAASPAEVARAAEIVLTCLPGPAEVEVVVGGPEGLLAGAAAGSIVVEQSTIDPGTSRRLAERAAARGVTYIDAPVSGGVDGAAAGTLTIMAGGPVEAVERCRLVFAAIGRRVYHLGPVGSGNLAKLCNQLVATVTYGAIAEALVLGARGGLDPEQLLEVLSTSSGRSRALEQAGPRMVSGEFAAAFTLDLAHKDVSCTLAAAAELGVSLRLGAVAEQLHAEARAAGLGSLDQAALVLPVERRAGTQVGRRRAGS